MVSIAARAGRFAYDELRHFLSALGYFTRLPIPRWVGYAPAQLNAAARYFPLVGALVGAIGAGVYTVASLGLPLRIAILLGMTATLLLTGGFHEDGLADCCDAFGGGMTRERTLEIMHDSRIGTFGALGLGMALLLKWESLTQLQAHLRLLPFAAAWVAAHAASRCMAISYLCTLDYVRAEGKAKPVAQRMPLRSMAAAACVGLPWLFWPDWRAGILTLAVLGLLRWSLGKYFMRRLGGYTGDCLGLAQQVFELAIYLTMMVVWI